MRAATTGSAGRRFPAASARVTAGAPARHIEDLFKKEVLVGSVGIGSSTSIVPTVINKVVGTKFRLVEGYRGAGDIILAMQRGEVQAGCMSYGQFRSHEQLFKEGKFKIILRAGGIGDGRRRPACRRSSTTPRPKSSAS